MNPSQDLVAEWIADRGLKLSIDETEAIILTIKRGNWISKFFLKGALLQPKEHIRYMGIELSKKWGFSSESGMRSNKGYEDSYTAFKINAKCR